MIATALSCECAADAVEQLKDERDGLMEVDGEYVDSLTALTAAQLTLLIDTMRGLMSLTFETDYKKNDILLQRGCTLLFVMMLVGAVCFFAVDRQGELHAMVRASCVRRGHNLTPPLFSSFLTPPTPARGPWLCLCARGTFFPLRRALITTRAVTALSATTS